nr:chromate transporter [Lachnospiraceae bacterium]
MIYLELFIGFLTVGIFAFGGAYAAIPIIRDVVLSYGWIDEATLMDMIAISESTPGSIIVNLATYVGTNRGGILGGIIATFAATFPAFVIILVIMIILKK